MMTDTKPIYIRAGKATLDKFTELVKLYGSQTQVFAVAIEYLYQREVNRTHPAPQPGGRVGERGGEMIEQVCPICGTKLQTAGDYPLTFCPVCDTITDEEAKQLQNMTIEEYEAYFAAKQEAQA